MNKTHRELVRCAHELSNEPASHPQVVRPCTGAYRKLHRQLNVGRVSGRSVIFSPQDRQIITSWLRAEGVDPGRELPPEHALSRTEVAAHQINEKKGAGAISQTRQLMSIAAAGDEAPIIAGRALESLWSGYVTLQANTGIKVEADWLLSVENLETFIDLCAEPHLLSRRGRGLLVFRGAPTAPHGMRWANAVSSHQGITHWHAPDLDPQGLSNCLSQSVHGVWLPRLDAVSDLEMDHALYDRQIAVIGKLRERAQAAFPGLLPWVDLVIECQGGLTQERAFAHQLVFQLVKKQSPFDRVD